MMHGFPWERANLSSTCNLGFNTMSRVFCDFCSMKSFGFSFSYTYIWNNDHNASWASWRVVSGEWTISINVFLDSCHIVQNTSGTASVLQIIKMIKKEVRNFFIFCRQLYSTVKQRGNESNFKWDANHFGFSPMTKIDEWRYLLFLTPPHFLIRILINYLDAKAESWIFPSPIKHQKAMTIKEGS